MSAENGQSSQGTVEQTALYALHTQLNGKLVEFAGYSMPVHYPTGIKAEHLHTRKHASLFDVSHMGQLRIVGENVATALETLVCGDICGLVDLQQRYTLLTNSSGGIIDDLMVTKIPEGLFLVVNAANKHRVFAYIQSQLELTCRVEMMVNQALLALQGPQAVEVLARFDAAIGALPFMHAGRFQIEGMDCLVSRCGYTGEDGFEISLGNKQAIELAELLLQNDEVQAAGLGARDSLRLEAGLCLHGHDINESTTPVEANLNWVIAARYRYDNAQALFPGADIIMQQIQSGPDKRLVGLRPDGKMPIREGSIILDLDGEKQGQVSSGGFGVSLNAPIAMGYVSSDFAQVGTELQVKIRDRFHTMRVAELPFVAHRYFKP